jgi:hypothetical protein
MWNWLISNLKDIFSKEFWKRFAISWLIAILITIGAYFFILLFGEGVPDRVWGALITGAVMILTLSVLISSTFYKKPVFWIVFLVCFFAAFFLARLLWK